MRLVVLLLLVPLSGCLNSPDLECPATPYGDDRVAYFIDTEPGDQPEANGTGFSMMRETHPSSFEAVPVDYRGTEMEDHFVIQAMERVTKACGEPYVIYSFKADDGPVLREVFEDYRERYAQNIEEYGYGNALPIVLFDHGLYGLSFAYQYDDLLGHCEMGKPCLA